MKALAVAALLVAVALLYAPALEFEFLSYDDPQYVTANPRVRAGLEPASVRWAFASAHAGNWHPLTWLSHMLDVECFGVAPAGPHAVNVALHALNAVLLFLALSALTGRRGRSFAVAALFALHPLQLESVAWVAERKNLLSTSFGLLALWAYAGYARRGGALRFTAVAAALAASLMAKAMLVTLPFVLLLLDVWPLARARTVPLRRLVLEKVPLLGLSLAVSAVVYTVQAHAGAMEPSASLPWTARVAYAPIAIVRHLAHWLWPARLAVLYPHPLLAEGATLDVTRVLLAVLALAIPTGLALLAARRGRPAAAIGWLFFLGTLVPVIGIVQVGEQALADRYAYVPIIGLAVALVWSAADALGAVLRDRLRGAAATLALAGVCALLAFGTRAQLGYWRSSRALFERALAVTGPNPAMESELGVLLAASGHYGEALLHLRQAAAYAPRSSHAHQNLGGVLAALGRPAEALPHLERGVALAPERANARVALATTLLDLGRVDEARAQLERAGDVPETARLRARLEALTAPAAGRTRPRP